MKRKFNVIDVLIIVVVIAVGIGGYFYITQEDKGDSVFVGKKKMTFMAQAFNIEPEVSKTIKEGDVLVANERVQDAIVKKVEIYDMDMVSSKDGELIAVKNPDKKRVVVTIEATVNKYGPYTDFAGQEVRSGVNYWIRTKEMHMYGQVMKIIE